MHLFHGQLILSQVIHGILVDSENTWRGLDFSTGRERIYWEKEDVSDVNLKDVLSGSMSSW